MSKHEQKADRDRPDRRSRCDCPVSALAGVVRQATSASHEVREAGRAATSKGLTIDNEADAAERLDGAGKGAGGAELAAEIAALGSMTYTDLRFAWRRLHRAHPPKKLSRDLLELGVAWKLQERVLGGLSATTKRQLDELARTLATKSDLAKTRRVSLRPGARLVRVWGGETHEILVVEDGFVWRGKTWRSLSVIAREMTGTHWSGPRFFGLGKTNAEVTGSNATTERAVDE